MMAISSTSESDWSWLPTDLLHSILHKLASPIDKVRFAAVCKSWGTAVKERPRQGTQIPMLLVPSKHNIYKARSLYSITDQTISDVNLPVPYNCRRCCGSSFGWLSFVTNTSSITLFNPFRNKKIRLPKLQKLKGYNTIGKQYTVEKVTLSSDPTTLEDSGCLVVAIYGEFNHLAFLKLGDESWTDVDDDLQLVLGDVLYYKGQVLVIDHRGELLSIDVNTNLKKTLAPRDFEYAPRTYLMETSMGDLLLVRRFFTSWPFGDDNQGITGRFEVYKLVLDKENGRVVKRVEVNNIGDDALFLGNNYSISVSASAFSGCHPNSIYYTDDYIDTEPYYPNGPIDMGIFNLEDRSIRLHYKPSPSHKYMSPPIWILLPKL
jgi:hypothetical protein